MESGFPGKTRRARYPFVAEITLENLASGGLVDGVTTVLGEGGCGMCASEFFPGNTEVLAKITKNGVTFATPAVVAYSLPPAAMGLAFIDMPPDQKQILTDWLRAAVPAIRQNARETASG